MNKRNEALICLASEDYSYHGFEVSIAEFDDGIFMSDIDGYKCENFKSNAEAVRETFAWINVYLFELNKFEANNNGCK